MSYGERIRLGGGGSPEGEPSNSENLRLKLLKESEILLWVARRFSGGDDIDFDCLYESIDYERENEFGNALNSSLAMVLAEVYIGNTDRLVPRGGIESSGGWFTFEYKDDEGHGSIRRMFLDVGLDGANGAFVLSVEETEEHFFFGEGDNKYDLVIETDGLGRVVGERLHRVSESRDDLFDSDKAILWVRKDDNYMVSHVGARNNETEVNGLSGRETCVWTSSWPKRDKFLLTSYFFDGEGVGPEEVSNIAVFVGWEDKMIAITDKRLLQSNEIRLTTKVFNISRSQLDLRLRDACGIEANKELTNRWFAWYRNGSLCGSRQSWYEGEKSGGVC